MMKNSDLFYKRALEYQNARNELEDKYTADMKKLKPHEGSLYFKEQTEKLSKEYTERLQKLKADTSKSFKTVIDGMKESIGRAPAIAPTAEQINLLNVLKMRNKVTRNDLDRAAESMKGCPLALKALSEIALEQGHLGYSRYISEMTEEDALKICDSPLIKDFLDSNTSRAARIGSTHNERLYGNYASLSRARRKTFTDKEGCFMTVMGIDGNQLQHFCELVDREGIDA